MRKANKMYLWLFFRELEKIMTTLWKVKQKTERIVERKTELAEPEETIWRYLNQNNAYRVSRRAKST